MPDVLEILEECADNIMSPPDVAVRWSVPVDFAMLFDSDVMPSDVDFRVGICSRNRCCCIAIFT